MISCCLFLVILAVLLSCSVPGTTSQQASSCVTPDNRPGTCVNVDDCPMIADILRNAPRPLPARVQNLIVRAHCGVVNNKHRICCSQPTLSARTNDNCTPNPVANSSEDIGSHRNLQLLPNTDCGPISTNKIAGGEIAALGEFPWMVLLKYNTPNGFAYHCGASIISKRYVMTAAHCISKLPNGYSLYSVIVGEQNTSTHPDCMEDVCNSERQELFFEEVIPHSTYDTPRFANDIGLIRLSQDISFASEFVQPVCLPITQTLVNLQFRFLIVSGWGKTENQTRPQDLLRARLNVLPMEDCRVAHRQNQFTDDQVCAKGRKLIDTCKGDSGGPLVSPTQVSHTARFVQFGIVSAGVASCGRLAESKPGIYVRVQRYMSWILDNMRE